MSIKVLDLETTGLATSYDRILEMSLLDLGEGPLSTWSVKTIYFDAGGKIPEASKRVHHLTEAFLAEASGGLSFAEKVNVVRAEYNSTVSVVGHNILNFDIPMLQSNLRRASAPVITYDKVYDMMLMAKEIPGIKVGARISKTNLYYELMAHFGFSREKADRIMIGLMNLVGVPEKERCNHNSAYDVCMTGLTFAYSGLAPGVYNLRK